MNGHHTRLEAHLRMERMSEARCSLLITSYKLKALNTHTQVQLLCDAWQVS